MKYAAAFLIGLTLVMPASAADTKQMTELYKGFKDAYAELNKLPADGNGVEKAKADLLERFRIQFGNEITRLTFAELGGKFNTARGDANAAKAAAEKSVNEEIGRLDAAVTSLKKKQVRLSKAKSNLGGQKTTAEKERDEWQTTTDDLIARIKALGGSAALMPFDRGFAAYPGRLSPNFDRAPRRSFIPLGAVRLALHKCPKNCGGGHGSGGGGGSPASKLAGSRGFGSVAPNMNWEEWRKFENMVKHFANAPKGLANLPSPGEVNGLFGDLRAKLPPVLTPPPDLANPLDDLQAKLRTSRQNLKTWGDRVTEITNALADVVAAEGPIPQRLSDLKASRAAMKNAALALDPGGVAGLILKRKGERQFWFLSVTWGTSTADDIFTGGRAEIISTVEIFGQRASLKTAWTFTDPAKSFERVIAATKASDAYTSRIEG